ncbi:hypothetical protein B0H19DRAFT_1271806 [Mycena capillaripes]|nr:hypothetical protein B0H19DRAFT_1271806 [Mycena capillaripes]
MRSGRLLGAGGRILEPTVSWSFNGNDMTADDRWDGWLNTKSCDFHLGTILVVFFESPARLPIFWPVPLLPQLVSKFTSALPNIVGQVGNMTGMQSMQKDGKERRVKARHSPLSPLLSRRSLFFDVATAFFARFSSRSRRPSLSQMQNAAGQAKTEVNKPMWSLR